MFSLQHLLPLLEPGVVSSTCVGRGSGGYSVVVPDDVDCLLILSTTGPESGLHYFPLDFLRISFHGHCNI